MTTPIVYVICDSNCKFEGMTKEQILTAIMQAVNEGTIGNIDAGFITKIKTINGTPLSFFVGDQAEYDSLTPEQKKDLFALITNDTTKDGILQAIEELQTATEENANNIEAAKKFELVYTHEIDTIKSGDTVTIDLTKLTYNTVYLVELLNTYSYSPSSKPLEAGGGVWIYREGKGGSITFGDVHFTFDAKGKGTFYCCDLSDVVDSFETIDIKGTINFYKLGGI